MTQPIDDTLVQSDFQREQSRELSMRADRPPMSIKGYTFLRRLGTGAYGSVWLAREDNTGKNVAIKFYTHRRGLDWSLLSREVEKLAVLYTSRNIVGLLDVGWNGDPPYYAMEYLENGSLATWLTDGGLEPEEAVRVATGIARGLVHAHGSGILHCDLKPANVLFDSENEPRLCDFGQSRLSHEQNPALGTLFYMAPEQADLRAVPDARWDVYALGALLYQMLTGSPPYRTSEAEERIRLAPTLVERLTAYRQLINDSPTPVDHRNVPGVDARLIEIVDRCLAIDPADRYRNAQAVLERFQSREQQRNRRPAMLLGVIGPILLLAVMAPLFVSTMSTSVKTLRSELTKRALESDALTARVQAKSLEDELDRRISELEDVLANPTLIEHLESASRRPGDEVADEFLRVLDGELTGDDVPQWVESLNQAYDRIDRRAKERGGSKDTSWFLTNADGQQLWRRGAGDTKASIQRKHYWYRDYFSGRGMNLPHEDLQPRPADVGMFEGGNHVSVAFRSTATDLYMVAVTVKILNKAGRVIGLLGRTTHLDEFRGRIIQSNSDDREHSEEVKREIALVDARDGHLLDHSWIAKVTRAARETSADEFPAGLRAEARTLLADPDAFYNQLTIDGQVQKALKRQPVDAEGHKTLTWEQYKDPVGKIVGSDSASAYRGNWLAALHQVRVGDAPWIVIIQERRADALDSVDNMSSNAIRYGLIAIFVSIMVIMGVWLFVISAIRNIERRPETSSSNR